MKRAFKFSLFPISLTLPAVLLFFFCPAHAAVGVEGGLVNGVVQDNVTIYKGIPFAAPPTGDLRGKKLAQKGVQTLQKPVTRTKKGCLNGRNSIRAIIQ